ncbi:MAG: hypothetical protein GXO74_05545 [Calditrichaeota bacterium]|nr:hypothetical protein [Calditrichota bacterium]
MSRNYYFHAIALIILAMMWLGCATTGSSRRTMAQYKSDLRTYIQRVKANPRDAEAYREIGIITFELKKYPLARKFLTKAYKFNPNDGKTLYFLGMTLEAQNQLGIALKVYKKYRALSKVSGYRYQLESRYQWVSRELIRQQMKKLLAQESQLSASRISPVAIAIFPFSYFGRDKKYAALGKGISEMMITDISQVKGLHPVERVRLQALMDEIGLGQSGMVKEDSAPRLGKLLGAGKIVAGSFDILSRKKVQFNAAFWDVLKNKFPPPTVQKDALNNIFRIEKDLVFSLLDDIGILVTPEEKAKIQQIPTKNFQAFLAYSQGLEMEDAGNFGKAAQFFQKAIRLDPGFGKAKQKQSKAKMLQVAAKGLSPVKKQLAPSTAAVGYRVELSKTDLINSRLNNLSASIGTIFIPGQDSRKSAQEAVEAGVPILGDLPLPPDPPRRTGINP